MRRQAIESATRSWIQRFVVREKLCPFAAASRILIRVDPFDAPEDAIARRVHEDWKLDPLRSIGHAQIALAAIERAERWIDELLEVAVASDSTSNLFIVYPIGLSDPAMYRAFAALLTQRAGLQLAGTTGEGEDAPAIAFPFHPAMRQPSLGTDQAHAADYRFASPFPMAHIIPQGQLSHARQQLRARKAAGGTCLLARNKEVMRAASEARRQGWESLLAACHAEAGRVDESRESKL